MAQTIYQKIENKGLMDAEEIKRLGEEKVRKLHDEIVSQTTVLTTKIIKEAEDLNNETIKTKKTELLQAASQSSLKNRKEIIQSLFDKVLEKIQNFNDDELTKYVLSLLSKANVEGNEVLVVNEKDYNRYKKLFSSKKSDELDVLNKKLGQEYNLKLANKSVDIEGGFVLEGEYFDIDFSYETTIRNMINQFETELSKILFEG